MPGETGMHAIRRMVANNWFSARSAKTDTVVEESAQLQELVDYYHQDVSPGKHNTQAHARRQQAYEEQRDTRVAQLNSTLDPVLRQAEAVRGASYAGSGEEASEQCTEPSSPSAPGNRAVATNAGTRSSFKRPAPAAGFTSSPKQGDKVARVGAEVGNTMPCTNTRPSLLRPRFGKPDLLPPDLTRQAQ